MRSIDPPRGGAMPTPALLLTAHRDALTASLRQVERYLAVAERACNGLGQKRRAASIQRIRFRVASLYLWAMGLPIPSQARPARRQRQEVNHDP